MHIVSLGDNMHEMSNPVFWEKWNKNITNYHLLDYLRSILSIKKTFWSLFSYSLNGLATICACWYRLLCSQFQKEPGYHICRLTIFFGNDFPVHVPSSVWMSKGRINLRIHVLWPPAYSIFESCNKLFRWPESMLGLYGDVETDLGLRCQQSKTISFLTTKHACTLL